MTIEFIGYSTLGGAQVNLDYCPICDTYIHVPCLAVLSCAYLNCPVFLNDFPIWIRSDNEPDPQTTIIRLLSYMWGRCWKALCAAFRSLALSTACRPEA